jgi:hypothetical protein
METSLEGLESEEDVTVASGQSISWTSLVRKMLPKMVGILPIMDARIPSHSNAERRLPKTRLFALERTSMGGKT